MRLFRSSVLGLTRVGRALIKDVFNVAQGKRPEGGSTITQQVAKNVLLTNEVSVGRKLKERFHACRKADGIHYCGFRMAIHRSPAVATIPKAKPVLVTTPAAPLTAREAVADAVARAACHSKGRTAM